MIKNFKKKKKLYLYFFSNNIQLLNSNFSHFFSFNFDFKTIIINKFLINYFLEKKSLYLKSFLINKNFFFNKNSFKMDSDINDFYSEYIFLKNIKEFNSNLKKINWLYNEEILLNLNNLYYFNNFFLENNINKLLNINYWFLKHKNKNTFFYNLDFFNFIFNNYFNNIIYKNKYNNFLSINRKKLYTKKKFFIKHNTFFYLNYNINIINMSIIFILTNSFLKYNFFYKKFSNVYSWRLYEWNRY